MRSALLALAESCILFLFLVVARFMLYFSQKNAAVRSHQSSDESILIENALEAFSFLDSEDYIGEER